MLEIRSIFFATLLSMAVLVGWQVFYDYNVSKEIIEKIEPQQNVQIQDQESIKLENISNELAAPTLNIVNQINDKSLNIAIENSKISGIFSKKGLAFNEVFLKNYKETLDANSPQVKLFDRNDPNNLFYADFGFTQIQRGELDSTPDNTSNNSIELPNQNSIWESDGDKLTPETPLTLSWVNNQNIKFITKITIDNDYLFTIERKVINPTNNEYNFNYYSRIFKNINNLKNASVSHEGVIGSFDKNSVKYSYEKLFKKESIHLKSTTKNEQSKLSWTGFGDKYWLASLIADDKYSNLHLRSKSFEGENKAQIEMDFTYKLPAQQEINRKDYLFVGAKELTILDKYSQEYKINMFDHAVDFGFLYFITKPIFLLLQFFYKLIGNFGVAIMILTVFIKLLLFPLSKKSFFSMHKMRTLQPQLDKIKEKYKEDKTKLNLEIVSLFRKNKISPFSSLVPLILQIPVFFALYKVLHITIEMRHAHFFGWIRDLSARDSLNIFSVFNFANLHLDSYFNIGLLSLILGATMLIQQKFQPTPTDNNQLMVMRWMPLIFTFISASFPAGLLVYWSWNNIISTVQQVAIEKFLIKKDEDKNGNNFKELKRK